MEYPFNIEPLVLPINRALRNARNVNRYEVAQNIAKSILSSKDSVEQMFGRFFGSCPYKVLKKCIFQVSFETVDEIDQVSMIQFVYYGDSPSAAHKVAAVNDIIRIKFKSNLYHYSNCIDFSDLRKIKFIS